MSSPTETEPYSLPYAAGLLKVSENWLATQARRRLVPHVVLGRKRVFMQADIDRILAQHRAEALAGLTPGSLRAKRRSA